MHIALYRAERPKDLNEIIGQSHIVKILKNQIASGSVSQAYLFSGLRGTGKTSTARILAKAVNCSSEGEKPCNICSNCKAIDAGTYMDVIELDAASNNGVDDIRNLIESVNYPPSVGKYKVYIVDEVHMLTQSAENAFLKTLEEPPEYAIFILATTNPEKVKETIKSRCMLLDFRRISPIDMTSGIKKIADKRNIKITDSAISEIVSRTEGSVRDAISLLEQCVSTEEEIIDIDEVLLQKGAAPFSFFANLTYYIISKDTGEIFANISEAVKEGKDVAELFSGLIRHFRNLLIVKSTTNPDNLIKISEENIEVLKMQSENLDTVFIGNSIKKLSEYANLAKYTDSGQILFETAVMDISIGFESTNNENHVVKPFSINEPKRKEKSTKKVLHEKNKNNEPLKKPEIKQEIRTKATSDDKLIEKVNEYIEKKMPLFKKVVKDEFKITACDGSKIIFQVSERKKSYLSKQIPKLKKIIAEAIGKEVPISLEVSFTENADNENPDISGEKILTIAKEAEKIFGQEVKIEEE